IETHDVKALLDHGFADNGLTSLIYRHLPYLSGLSSPDRDSLKELLDAYQITGFLYRLAAPNSGVAGECLGFPGERFFIVQMPPWLRFFMNSSYPADMSLTYEADSTLLHFGHRDGFLVVAASPQLVAEILTNWESGANPLGEPPEGEGPRFYMAKRPDAAAESRDAGPDQPGHFMFADPFAPAEPGRPAVGVGDTNKPFAARLSLTPAKGGWNVVGELAPGGDWLGPDDVGLDRGIRDVLGIDAPTYRGNREVGLVARLDASPDLMEHIRRTSARYARDASFIPGEFRRDLAAKWLHDAWLASAGTVWHLAVRRPRMMDLEMTFPKLPVVSFGWHVRETTTPDDAARAYGMALAEWLDKLKDEPVLGGRLDLDSLIRYRLDQNDLGRGGRITVPPILLNGAEPAWRFNIVTGDAWFATDPSGVPEDGSADALKFTPSNAVKMPAAGLQAVMQGEWTFNDRFLFDMFALATDRFYSLPDRYRMPWLQSGTDPVVWMVQVLDILRSYPAGAFTVHGDFEIMRVRFTSYIPYGKNTAPAE
ncbi:MAG: hypothetical protein LUG50_02420, partial [Planctomycetaceae bacterium]|nr:hypothetical protein [Planctomycetaceae bacterium]